MGINIVYSSDARCCLSLILFCFSCICCMWRGFVWSLHHLGMGFLLCQHAWECLLRQNEQSNMYPWKLVINPWLLLFSLTIPKYYFCKFLIKLQISGIGFLPMRPFGWSVDQPLLSDNSNNLWGTTGPFHEKDFVAVATVSNFGFGMFWSSKFHVLCNYKNKQYIFW